MLSRRYRFHSRGGVRFVQRHGKMVRGAKMALVYGKNERGFTRVGVVVSKKVDKRAVVRNRIRRRIYEVVRLNLEAIPKKMDYIIIIYSAEVATMPFFELEKLVGKLMLEAKN